MTFTEHVLQQYPREACGVMVGGTFIPCENTAEDPTRHFRLNPLDLVRHGKVEAIMHSHPYSRTEHRTYPPEWPSHDDVKGFMATNVPWVIVATDGEGVSEQVVLRDTRDEPLTGRPFIHGIFDCYSLVRDWFWQHKQVTLPNFPRQMGWWHTDADLYIKNFEAAGFKEISIEDVQVGDCLLMRYAARCTNHAAVVTGDNRLLHHIAFRLSGEDYISAWSKNTVKGVRYVG